MVVVVMGLRQWVRLATAALGTPSGVPDRIPAGEEVLMSYLPVNEPVTRRRRRIKRTFGFVCACPRCAGVRWAKGRWRVTGSDGEVVVDRGGGGGGGVDEAAVEAAEAAAEARKRREQRRWPKPSRDVRNASLPEYAMWFARNMVRENTSHARGGLSLYFFSFFSPPVTSKVSIYFRHKHTSKSTVPIQYTYTVLYCTAAQSKQSCLRCQTNNKSIETPTH